MELVSVEESRIVFLTQVYRPAGLPYLPELVAKLIARYSFVKYPNFEDIGNNVKLFAYGKFLDVQINELKIYDDGIIVSAKANTEILDIFVDDLFKWLEEDFGVVKTILAKPERHYESQVVVSSESDLPLALAPRKDAIAKLQALLSSDKYVGGNFSLTGFNLDCDPDDFHGRRKPSRFVVERRVGVKWSENVFFSVAPLRTPDHLNFLMALERFALGF